MKFEFLRRLEDNRSGYIFYFNSKSSLLYRIIYSKTIIKGNNEINNCVVYSGYKSYVVETEDIKKYLKKEFKDSNIILIKNSEINPIFNKNVFLEEINKKIKKLIKF